VAAAFIASNSISPDRCRRDHNDLRSKPDFGVRIPANPDNQNKSQM
jgi:hypothetical protein